MKYIRQYYLAKASNIAYLKMPKCACTSIKIAVGKMRFGPQMQSPKSVHHLNNYPTLFGGVVRDYDPVLDALFKFTFVRDPIERVFSFYKNKIVDFDAAVSPHYHKLGFSSTDTFEDFVDKLVALDHELLEEHLVPQSYYCFDDGIPKVDFVGRIETIQTDWELIKEVSGFDIDLTITNRTNKNERRAEFNKETIEKLKNYYLEDCQKFGYQGYGTSDVIKGINKQANYLEVKRYTHLSIDENVRVQGQLIENLQINLSLLKEQVAFSNKILKEIQMKIDESDRKQPNFFQKIVRIIKP